MQTTDTNKLHFLKQNGLLDNPDVIDCDVDKRTVSMMVDGVVIERQICEIYTRIMGYHRPVTDFNVGKRQEHKDRTYFIEK